MKQDVAVIFSRASAGLLTQQDIGTAGYPRAFGEPSTPPTALRFSWAWRIAHGWMKLVVLSADVA